MRRAGAVDVVAEHQHERERKARAPRHHLIGDLLLPAIAAAGVADDGEPNGSFPERQRDCARCRVKLPDGGGGGSADLRAELGPAETGGNTERKERRENDRREENQERATDGHARVGTDSSGFHANATNCTSICPRLGASDTCSSGAS